MPNYSQTVADPTATRHFTGRFDPYTKSYFEEDKHRAFPCRFCGKPMYVYKTVGNIVYWACATEGCFNNPDTKRPDVSNAQYVREMNRVGNVSNFWKNMRPVV